MRSFNKHPQGLAAWLGVVGISCMSFFTVGHSNHSSESLIALLQSAAVEALIDVRSFPGSKRNPQFNAERLAADLAKAAIFYRHLPTLGGRRGPQALVGASPNAAWEETAFRNYADYAMGHRFQSALRDLIAVGELRTTAILCAEADWRRCHRRIIADHLLVSGRRVVHLLPGGDQEVAVTDPRLRLDELGRITYPPRQCRLL